MANFSAVTYALAKKYADTLFSKVDLISVAFVDKLPSSDIKEKTIYFIPRDSEDPTDYIYDEYMYIEGQWKHIGSTELHLEDYYTKAELQEVLPSILPKASTEKIGGIKIDGKTVVIDENGIISVQIDPKEESPAKDAIETIAQETIDSTFTTLSKDDINNIFSSI